jgi:GAF domain-containing protein
MEEVYPIVCQQLSEAFNVDGAVFINFRLDSDPVNRAILVSAFPGENRSRYEFHIPAIGYLRDMITYYKPVHIPDLDKAYDFRLEFEKIFPFPCRSVLLLPMQLAGKSVGFIGMYMQDTPRVFNLVEIELSQRLADTAAAVLISIFFKKHVGIHIDRVEEHVVG